MPHDVEQRSSRRSTNPFLSSTNSVHDDPQTLSTPSNTVHTSVDIDTKRSSFHATPRIQPAPPPRAVHRDSYQSSHRSSRPVSRLPRIADPEKAIDVAATHRWNHTEEFPDRAFLHENSAEIKSKCLKVLLYLSGPVLVTSIALAIWTVLSLVIAALLAPLNFVRKSKTFREQSIDFLAPALKIHLSCILIVVQGEQYASYSLPILALVNMFAPLMAVVVVLSAWTAACFWLYATILGDPEGLDRESRRSSYMDETEEDGKASALRVRRWWRGVLLKPLR